MVALALALGVYPATLLTPDAADGTEQVAVTGMAEKLDAEWLWYWLCAHEPIDPGVDTIQFQMAPAPAVAETADAGQHQVRHGEIRRRWRPGRESGSWRD